MKTLSLFPALCLALASTAAAQQSAPQPNVPNNAGDSARTYRTPSITVTSTRAEERRSPATFAEISGAELRQRHTLQDIPALLGELPSTVLYSDNGSNIGYTTLTMRGFDQRRIAVLVNGVPQNDPEDHNVYWIDFPDMAANLQSVQVQRGAGLVNYGAAAVGGSVNLTTSNFATAGFARFSGGIIWQQYDGASTRFVPISNRMSAEVASGLHENYAVYARLTTISTTGYRDRSWAELGSFFLSAARFDERVTTQITVYGGPLADGLAYNGIPKQFITDPERRRANFNYFDYNPDSLAAGREVAGYLSPRRNAEIENFSQPHYEILNDIQFSEDLSLKSTLFYYTGDGFFDYDGSWADTTTLRLTAQYGFRPADNPRNAIITGAVANKHGGWIPRFVLRHDSGELTAGAEIRLHRSNRYGRIRYAELLPEQFDPDYNIYEYNGIRDIFSVFAREQYDVSPEIRLTGEFQIVRHRYAIENERAGGIATSYTDISGNVSGNGGEIFSLSYLFVNPRIGLNFNPNEQCTAYFAAAFTSREPRMRNLYAAEDSYFGAAPQFAVDTAGGAVRYDFSKPLVKPERLLNIEIGGAYAEETYRIRAGAYLMEFTDELVRNGKLDIFGNPVDGNAKRSRHAGIELEAAVTLLDSPAEGRLTIGGNATFSSNRFVDYEFFPAGGGNAISLNDNPIAGFPDVIANLRAEYVAGEFRAALTVRHIGRMFSDSFGDRLQEFRAAAPALTDYIDNVIPAASIAGLEFSYNFRNMLALRQFRLRCAVQNLFNTLYAAGATGKEFFPAAARSIFMGVEAEL